MPPEEDEKVVEETTEESTASDDSTATETEKATETSKGKGNTVPYDRFKEVVEQKNEFATRYEALETKLGEEQGKLGQMIDLLNAKEEDSRLIAAIRQLGADPTHRDLVEQLDNVLQGKEPEGTTETEDTAEDTDIDKKTAKLLAETKETLEGVAENQKAEMLLMRAKMLADQYMDALPDQYTENDKMIIGKLYVDNVDWETIEEEPDTLNDKVAEGFESTLKEFGDPRGTVAEKKEETKTTETEKATSKEPEVPEYVAKDWGKMKEVKLPDGKTILQPEQSDEDFVAALAQTMKDNLP